MKSVETEEFLSFVTQCDDGEPLDAELCRKLLSLPGQVEPVHESPCDRLTTLRTNQIQICLTEVETSNATYFDEEEAKLERWADNLKYGLEQEIKDVDLQLKEAKPLAKATITLAEKLNAQKEVKALETKGNQKRRELYNAQDEIEQMRDELISAIEQLASLSIQAGNAVHCSLDTRLKVLLPSLSGGNSRYDRS